MFPGLQATLGEPLLGPQFSGLETRGWAQTSPGAPDSPAPCPGWSPGLAGPRIGGQFLKLSLAQRLMENSCLSFAGPFRVLGPGS